MRAVAEVARRLEWDVVLLSELRADEKGVVWAGEEKERVHDGTDLPIPAYRMNFLMCPNRL